MAKSKALKLDWKMAGAAAGVLWCIHKIRKGVNSAIKGIGAAKKYYVYAGYYENYISSEPMPEPYVLRKTFRDIDSAIDFADSFGDEIIYCDNVKYDLPDYLYEALQDEDYDFLKYSGVGSVDWYHAVWVAQNELGIDFDKSYFAQDQSKMYDLAKLGKRLGYRRSYDNGKSYGRAFYDALSRRAEKINAEISQYER